MVMLIFSASLIELTLVRLNPDMHTQKHSQCLPGLSVPGPHKVTVGSDRIQEKMKIGINSLFSLSASQLDSKNQYINKQSKIGK